MAKQKVPPSLARPQTTIACAYCEEPTIASKRITADRKIFCGKLCAALALILAVHEEDGIDGNVGIDFFGDLVKDVLYEGPRPVPRKVRYDDALDAQDVFNATTTSAGHRFVAVVIDDEGTPDWVPDPSLKQATAAADSAPSEPSQAEIDRVVENLLRDDGEKDGRP